MIREIRKVLGIESNLKLIVAVIMFLIFLMILREVGFNLGLKIMKYFL